MNTVARLRLVSLVCLMLTGCHNSNNSNNSQSAPVLRKNLAIDLSQVSAFAVISGTSGASSAALTGSRATRLDSTSSTDGTASTNKLYALTLSGDTLEVTFVVDGSGQPASDTMQPGIQAVFPTASWVLFTAGNFDVASPTNPSTSLHCSLIAARRADGAIFCAPLYLMNHSADLSNAVHANGAGDVVCLQAADSPATPMDLVDTSTERLYRIALGGADGPVATAMLDTSTFMLGGYFELNAAGDLYLNYVPNSLSGTSQSQVFPLDGSSPFPVQGGANGYVRAGKVGDVDENTFYVVNGGGGGVNIDGTIRVVSKSGDAFSENDVVVIFPNNDASAYGNGFYRLSDGIYMFSNPAKSLVKVVANGAVITNPTPVALVGVDSIVGQGGTGTAVGMWIFIAATGSSYKFVRHDGVTQQDIPFAANIDVKSYTVGADGSIDFLGIDTNTLEKIYGTVAAGATDVVITSAGVLDPNNVVYLTRIN